MYFLIPYILIELFAINVLMLVFKLDHFIKMSYICYISMKRSSLQ